MSRGIRPTKRTFTNRTVYPVSVHIMDDYGDKIVRVTRIQGNYLLFLLFLLFIIPIAVGIGAFIYTKYRRSRTQQPHHERMESESHPSEASEGEPQPPEIGGAEIPDAAVLEIDIHPCAANDPPSSVNESLPSGNESLTSVNDPLTLVNKPRHSLNMDIRDEERPSCSIPMRILIQPRPSEEEDEA